MKARWMLTPIIVLLLITAGGLTTQGLVTEQMIAEPVATQDLAPEELAKKTGCLKCHSVDKKVIGPAYRDVAERYKDNPRARDILIGKVKNGGKGNWTEISDGVPMPPHSARLSTADIGRLVDWVLSHKDR